MIMGKVVNLSAAVAIRSREGVRRPAAERALLLANAPRTNRRPSLPARRCRRIGREPPCARPRLASLVNQLPRPSEIRGARSVFPLALSSAFARESLEYPRQAHRLWLTLYEILVSRFLRYRWGWFRPDQDSRYQYTLSEEEEEAA